MNNKKPRRLHDPKIQPPPAESVELTVDFSKEELRAIDEVIRADGFWSRAEFIRAATAEGTRSYRNRYIACASFRSPFRRIISW